MTKDKLAWLDLETEGLDLFHDDVLEIGVVITDLQLNILEERSRVILPYRTWTESKLKVKNPFVYDMHSSSGLLEDVATHGEFPHIVDSEIQIWLQKFDLGQDQTDPVCGSSVHFDRGFLKQYFPQINSGFSYRNIDVSSEKETVIRYHPDWYEEWQALNAGKPKAHRTLADIRNSIAEFKFYREKYGDL